MESRFGGAAVAAFMVMVVVGSTLPPAAMAQEASSAGSGEPGSQTAASEGDPTTTFDPVRLIFRAGASFAALRDELDITGFGPSGFEPDFGFAAGVAVEVRLTEKLSLQPEVVIVRRFTELELEPGSTLTSSKLSVNYLELPLLLKWHPKGRRVISPNLIVGMAPGLLLQAARELRSEGTVTVSPADEILNTLDLSLVVGGGYVFPEAFADFMFDFRYLHGFKKVSEVGPVGSARWSGLQLTVGVVF